jgi:SNF2 family DNA or RNA helicase
MAELLHADLFKVQREALSKGHLKSGFAYFMEMGLGKTRVVYYDFHFHARAKRVDCLFVACPASLRGTWQEEAETIGLEYPVVHLDGPVERTKQLIAKIKGPFVVVCHYDIILTRGGELLEWLIANYKVMVALDESTRIKNHESKVGQRLYDLVNGFRRRRIPGKKPKWEVTDGHPRAVYKRVLSGSPAPQGPHDLWNQFYFIEAVKQNFYSFKATYCRTGGWRGKQVIGSQNLDVLRMRTAEAAFRAKKNDPQWELDLPPQLPAQIRDVPMTPKQRQAYLDMMHHFVVELGDTEITAKMAITAKTKLQQIGSGFLYDGEGVAHNLFPRYADIPKVREALDIVEQIDNKLIIFYHFTHTLTVLRGALTEAGVNAVYLESGLERGEIDARKKMFNEDDSVKVVVCQGTAMKYGLTLLGTERQPCHTTLFFENTYDFEARVQQRDRNHRHGQKYPVTYIDLATSREDRKILKALDKKDGDMDALMRNFEQAAIDVLAAEIKELSSGRYSDEGRY